MTLLLSCSIALRHGVFADTCLSARGDRGSTFLDCTVQYVKQVYLYARSLIEKSGVITLFFSRSCNLSDLPSSSSGPLLFPPALRLHVFMRPPHTPRMLNPPCKPRICHGGLGISNHFKQGNEVTSTPSSRGVQIVV